MEPTLSVKILLVDDRPENLLALEAILARPDYHLVRAGSGREALRQLLLQDFAVILLDAQMPEMDGFETADLIRSREKSRHTPIIFLTAIYSDERYVRRGYEAGAVDYLTKPFDPDILKSKVAVFVDLYRKTLTIQLQAEELLRERLERLEAETRHSHYRAIMNGLNHSIIWEADSNLRFLFVSKRAELLLGYPHARWFSEEGFFLNRVPSEDRELVARAFRQVAETGKDQRCEHRMISADGTVNWYHTGIQCEQKDGSSEATLQGLTVDVTPLKLSEEELRRREAKYRRVVEANMLGHFFSNLRTGEILEANDCFLDMVGYSRQDLEEERIRWTDMTPPEYRELDQRAIDDLRTTGVCTPFEKEYFRKDGSRVPVMIGAARVDDTTDECVCFALDLTERKHAEEEKTQAVRSREEMLEIVSHDLKNPLAAILMNAVLLFKKIPPDQDSAALRKQVEGIQHSAERMKRLIEDLLDLSKVEQGRLIITKEPVSPSTVVSETLGLMFPGITTKHLEVEAKVPETLPEVPIDRERMIQVLSNLIGNAVKFTPEGGKITVDVHVDQNEARFEVSDNGPGIAREHLPHIFNRFWQAKDTAKQGTGLGLTIAKGIVDAHGGKIWAKSEPGKGCTFVVSLPRKAA